MAEETQTGVDIRAVIHDAIQEFVRTEQAKAEPAYKAELVEERKRREHLEQRLNDLAEENRKSRQAADEAERNAAVRSELQRLGVAKVDLAFKAVKDDVTRSEDGRIVAKGPDGALPLKDYLTQFVNENPELLPARISGGSGAGTGNRPPAVSQGPDIEKIRPGMSPEELERMRQEISRIATQTLKGQ